MRALDLITLVSTRDSLTFLKGFPPFFFFFLLFFVMGQEVNGNLPNRTQLAKKKVAGIILYILPQGETSLPLLSMFHTCQHGLFLPVDYCTVCFKKNFFILAHFV